MEKEFLFFQRNRIDCRLLQVSSFVKALQLIEISIGNPNLSVKFSQTCIPSLRNEPLYDLTESLKHIQTIYEHLVTVIQNIQLKVEVFSDHWSTFQLGHRRRASFDKITFDRSMITDAKDIQPDDILSQSRLSFFFYAKLLHELAHACLAQMGRQLPDGNDDDRFSSPATHAITGEAGDAIERHFFGSVIDAIGNYVDHEKNVFKIDYLILRERRNKQVITDDFLCYFNGLNLTIVKNIPTITTRNLPSKSPLKRKRSDKLCRIQKSPSKSD